MRPKIFIFLALLLIGRTAICEQSYNFFERNSDLKTKHGKAELAFGVEIAQIQPASGAVLVGLGPRFGVDYDFGNNFSFNPSVALVTTGATFIYSGLNGSIRYTINGSLSTRHQVLTSNGVPIITQTVSSANRLSIGLGIEQLFLNGSQSVYPASGISASVAYATRLLGQRVEINGRLSQLSANQRNLSAIYIDFSFLLGI